MGELLVIVPTRGRPDNVRRVIEAWEATEAFCDAELMVASDLDDPERDRYAELTAEWAGSGCVSMYEMPTWQPMVPKLNAAAAAAADQYDAVAFAGDDHLPRTRGWARSYLEALNDLGTGIVYGNDLLMGEKIPTQWAMTADIVQALGRMVPAPVEHLNCDNAIYELGKAADCIRYLPDVIVEHMHPAAGKSANDAGYRRVNSTDQVRRDGAQYQRWHASQLQHDVALVRESRRAVATDGGPGDH